MLLVVVVVGVAAIGNRDAGGLAAVSAAAWFDFFFTVPYYRFTIRGSADITTAVLLLVVGVAVSQLAARARRLQVIAITDAGYLAQIQQTVSLTQTAGRPMPLPITSGSNSSGCWTWRVAAFEYGSLLGRPPRLEPDGTVIAGHSKWDVEESGLPGEEIELRTFGNGQYYGRFMMKPKPGSKPSLQARLVAVTLADQAGRAFSATATTRAAR